VFSTASVGIALSATGYDQPEDLRDADTAMYHAKALGKARYGVFDTAMHANTKALLQLETDLRRAVERQELQFITSRLCRCKATEWVRSACALAASSVASFSRRVHCSGGRNWTDHSIGRWVLHEACCQMRKWHARFSKAYL